MKQSWKMLKRPAVECVVGVLVASIPVAAQSSAIITVNYSAQPAQGGEVLREIDDPANGCRWLLERDAQHPGGPGRMVLVAGMATGLRESAATQLPVPVIRAGDPLLLEAHTATMDAELEAVALAPAAVGSELEVRLKIGGRVLRAAAVAPGRAEWLESGAER